MELPVRKSPRLKNYDYSSCGAYSITISTYHHHHLLGTIDLLEPEKSINLSEIGLIVQKTLEELPRRFPGFVILKYSIMPNHLHILLEKNNSSPLSTHTVSDFVCALKSLVTKEIRLKYPGKLIWHGSFHDHIIRDDWDLEKHWEYIDQNVTNWQNDEFFERA